jgi:hypothetical protein
MAKNKNSASKKPSASQIILGIISLLVVLSMVLPLFFK